MYCDKFLCKFERVPGLILRSEGKIKYIVEYEIIYQLDAIEYLLEFFQLDMFRAYMPIFRSDGCYNFFTYAAYGVLGLVWLVVGVGVLHCYSE